jgi:hypothetical protein
MIEDFAAIEANAVSPAFLQHVLDRHRGEAQLFLALAAQEWMSEGCARYSDVEVACTAALVGCLQRRLLERRASGFQLHAFLETGGWTEAHLDGRLDPTTVPRPDIALFLGVHHDVRMTIECKRLLEPSATARDYVVDGLCRFLAGKYSSDEGQATMIGFLLDRDVDTAYKQINDVIHHMLDTAQVLRDAGALQTFTAVYRSSHPQASIEATHLLLDMRDRKPPTGTPPPRRRRRWRSMGSLP